MHANADIARTAAAERVFRDAATLYGNADLAARDGDTVTARAFASAADALRRRGRELSR